jgi:hypothetical protein
MSKGCSSVDWKLSMIPCAALSLLVSMPIAYSFHRCPCF